MVKKCEDMFIGFDKILERDRWTDRHHMTAIAALMHSIVRQKSFKIILKVNHLGESFNTNRKSRK